MALRRPGERADRYEAGFGSAWWLLAAGRLETVSRGGQV